MKKFLCIAIVIVLCSLSLGAVAAPKGSAKQRIQDKLNAAHNGTTVTPEDDSTVSMSDLSWQMKSTAERRTHDDDVYWKVTVDDLVCNYDLSSDEEDAVIVNIDLTWDAMNGVPRTKTMLRMFSDDMAQSIFSTYDDVNINQLWCRWAAPYLYDMEGFIAKYKYEKDGDAVYLTDSNGLLFNMADDYK